VQELVRHQLSSFGDGAWFIDLASVADSTLVPDAVLSGLDLIVDHPRDVRQVLASYLREKQLLLVLDNCEHVVDACAELARALLYLSADLRVLATSREPLGIAGETIWRADPLELPDLTPAVSMDEVARSASGRLFIEHAQAVAHQLMFTDAQALAVARICHILAGIPLALELAAAQLRVFTVQQLADRLEHDSGAVGGGLRVGEPRHRTLRATIDWSHDVLSEPEQVLLRRLSVSPRGWTLQLAEAVCSDDRLMLGDVFELLTRLVDKSLVVAETERTVARYRLLEPVRRYARERLDAAGEAAVYDARFATGHVAALCKPCDTVDSRIN
jgi:non-specific serine/threonine protein kinase